MFERRLSRSHCPLKNSFAMENRRRHFRQSFQPPHGPKIVLAGNHDTISIQGAVRNLSIGGLCVETTDPRIEAEVRWTASLSLDGEPMVLLLERVYAQKEEHACCGFRVLPPTNLNTQAAQEKGISKFLFEQQRSERRRRQEAAGAAK
jgi:c-di-GMP-binding flagellar brake protein YcgR